MKKIAYVSSFCFVDNIGGVENHILFMIRELKKLDCEVVVFQPKSGLSEVTEIYFHGIRVLQIPYKKPKILSFLENSFGGKYFRFLSGFINKFSAAFATSLMVKNIEEYNPDFIHQHDFISNILSTKKLSKKYPVFLTNHTGEYLLLAKHKIGRLFLKWGLNHYKGVIGPSIELTPKKYCKNSVTIHNGVNFDVFKKYELSVIHEIKCKHHINDDDFVVLCPRRWAPTKGVKYLAESIVEYDYPKNIKFLFAGSDYQQYPKYSNEVKDILSLSGRQDAIILLGNLTTKEMNECLNISDVVVIPSLMEAVSLSAVEAMATDCVVVSTNVGGMPELITDHVNGILINAESSREIYEAIIKLYESPELLEELKHGAQKTIANYSWRSIARETLHFIESLI